MYKLSMFQKFDFAAWQNDKSFMIQNVKYNTRKIRYMWNCQKSR